MPTSFRKPLVLILLTTTILLATTSHAQPPMSTEQFISMLPENGLYIFERRSDGKLLTYSYGRTYYEKKMGIQSQVFQIIRNANLTYSFQTMEGAITPDINFIVPLPESDEDKRQYNTAVGQAILEKVENIQGISEATHQDQIVDIIPVPCDRINNAHLYAGTATNHNGNPIQTNGRDQPLALFNESYTVPVSYQFKMVVTSDPQYTWASYYNKDLSQSEKDEIALQTLKENVSSINRLNGLHNRSIKGVIVNGDLTSKSQSQNFREVERVYSKLYQLPVYWGLGNHDVTEGRESNGLDWMRSNLYSMSQSASSFERDMNFREVSRKDGNFQGANVTYIKYEITGSMAYSWVEGNIKFIQLQYYPGYSTNAFLNIGMQNISGSSYSYKISNSFNWLRSQLDAANSSGQKVVINMHLPPFDDKISSTFRSIMQDYKDDIIAIFCGHLHYFDCRTGNYEGIPVFINGAAFNHNYYLLTFTGKEMIVRKHLSTNGNVNTMRDNWVIPY